MKLNDWECCTEKFLTKAFDEDSFAIVNYIGVSGYVRVMEIGFGNNRLLPKILKLPNIQYFGFDKTLTFVERAKETFKLPNVFFEFMDLEDLDRLTFMVSRVRPQTLILRAVLEHIPNWQRVVKHLNTLTIPSIIISTFTKPVKKSWSEIQQSPNGKNTYTLNFISNIELNGLLNNYELVEIIKYRKRTKVCKDTFRAYELK